MYAAPGESQWDLRATVTPLLHIFPDCTIRDRRWGRDPLETSGVMQGAESVTSISKRTRPASSHGPGHSIGQWNAAGLW
jgi:hypothetical protein